MNAQITLTATGGPLKGQEFAFADRVICTIGRSDDCLLRIRGDASNLTVSRRHCLLTIDPPVARVRDLGSLNGTFVNGRRIGQREKGTPPWEAIPADLEGVELHDGDRLVVGGSEFLITILNPAPEGDPDFSPEFSGQGRPAEAGARSGQSYAGCC